MLPSLINIRCLASFNLQVKKGDRVHFKIIKKQTLSDKTG